MGVGYFNIHVYVDHRHLEDVLSHLSGEVQRFLERKHYTLVPHPVEGDEVDRFVVLKPHPSHQWIAVYHDEYADLDFYHGFPAYVSAQIDGDVVAVWLDSHALLLRRYTRGILVDTFCTTAKPFALPHTPDVQSLSGTSARWVDLLLPPAQEADLEALWQREAEYGSRISDEIVIPFAALLGIDQELVQLTCDDMNTWEPEDDPYLHDATILAFRSRLPQPMPEPGSGTPRFVAHASHAWITQDVHTDLQAIYVDFFNTGGAATGLTIELWGNVVTQGVLTISSIDIGVMDGQQHRVIAVNNLSHNQQSVFQAEGTDIPIPEGIVDPYTWNAFDDRSGRTQALLDQATIGLWIHARAERSGTGDLHIRLYHSVHERTLSDTITIPVTIHDDHNGGTSIQE